MELCPNCVNTLEKKKLRGIRGLHKKSKCSNCGYESSDYWKEIEEQLRIDNLKRNEYDRENN